MEKQEVRIFRQISEMDEENTLRFYDFDWLNNFLNQNTSLGYRELYNAYVRVILDI